MNTIPDMRFIYRVIPRSSIIAWSLGAAGAVGVAIWSWNNNVVWDIPFLAVVTTGILLRIGFLRTRIFLVNADGLTVIKRPLIGILGTFDFFRTNEIRCICYRSEAREDWLDAMDYDIYRPRMHYILEVMTTKSQIAKLLATKDIPFNPQLGKRLAKAVDVPYEEYLDDDK